VNDLKKICMAKTMDFPEEEDDDDVGPSYLAV
jgi:hypothetical protein